MLHIFPIRNKERILLTGQEAKAFKTSQLDYVTFSGIFTSKKDIRSCPSQRVDVSGL